MKKPVVVLIDDEPAVLQALRAEVGPAIAHLATVEAFSDPHQALSAVERWKRERRGPAVAVVDETMAQLGGLEIVQQLRSAAQAEGGDAGRPPLLKAILLTDRPDLNTAIRAVNQAGIARYFDKPWPSGQVRDAVRELLLRSLEAAGGERTAILEAEILASRSNAIRKPGAVRRVRISAIGAYVPPRLLTNEDLGKMVDTTPEWIVERTGVHTRHVVDPGTATSDLALQAARQALDRAGVTPQDLGAIIVATTTPDTQFPSTACRLQHALGAPRAWGYDLGAACSGFLFGLASGSQIVATGALDSVLVVGADTMSSIVDYQDRTTCVLFGDGAGAAVLTPSDRDGKGILDHALFIDGSGQEALCMPAGGSRQPASHETVEKRLHFVHQDGRAVFKFAVRRLEEMCRLVLDRNDLDGEDIDLFVPHQANIRIIQQVAERLGMPPEKIVINLDHYGNTTAASIPLALAEAEREGRLAPGDLVLLAAVGAGFTMGAMLVRWG